MAVADDVQAAAAGVGSAVLFGGVKVSKKRPPETTPQKTIEQAERDCDWIALHGWDWWRTVVADAEQRAKATAREDV